MCSRVAQTHACAGGRFRSDATERRFVAFEPQGRTLSCGGVGDAEVLLHVFDDVHDHLHLHHCARHQGGRFFNII